MAHHPRLLVLIIGLIAGAACSSGSGDKSSDNPFAGSLGANPPSRPIVSVAAC